MYFEMTETNNLEHILPRTPSTDWRISEEKAGAYYKRLGNMTLCRSKSNVDAGNLPFLKKKSFFKDSTWLMTHKTGAV